MKIWNRVVSWGIVVLMLVGSTMVAGCSGSDGGGGTPAPAVPAAGIVTGQVVSLANSAPVSGATVKTEAGTTTTAADGKFSVPAPTGDRTIVQVAANGFAEAFPVARVTAGQTTNLGIKLVPTGTTATVSVASGDTVSVPNSTARVTIPANGLVPQAGGTPAGTVTVSVTPINPSQDTNLMPGGFSGISAGGGATQPIESFGAMLVDIRDSAGARYTLAGGKTSTIRIPLGTQSANPPATVPLWFFDETAGVWKEEGTATLQGTAPNQYYEGTVAHFSYWNADIVTERIFVTGCVKDANGQPVTNAGIRTEGIDYTGVAIGYTAADGTFQAAMRKNSRAKLGLFEFDLQTFNFVPLSNTVNVGPSATDIPLANCLVKKPGSLTITTAALPGGNVGGAYNQTLAAAGGVPGYVWSLNTGSNFLPSGLELNPSGLITGTPTATGTTTIILKVSDSAGGTATKEFTLTVSAPGGQLLVITSAALPAGTVGTAYNATLAASGGTGTRTWSIVSGSLPAGLTLNASTGVISGTPMAPGTFTCTVRVQDSGTPPQSAERQLTALVSPSDGGGGGTGGGGGQLTVSNAPASVGGTFVADGQVTQTVQENTGGAVAWGETVGAPLHIETMGLGFDRTGQVTVAAFGYGEPGVSGVWQCDIGNAGCPGATINRASGIATFTNVVLRSSETNSPANREPITLNGTLTFTPF